MIVSKFVKWFLVSAAVIIFTACGGSSSNDILLLPENPSTAQEIAIDKIATYAQDGGTPPTVEDYIAAGVEGVTADNLAEINEVVENLTAEDVDTEEEIQALADELGIEVEVPEIPEIIDNTAPVITLIGNETVSLMQGDTYTEEGATATDDTDGNLTSSITIEGNVNTSTAGTYTLSYTVKDSAGNGAEVNRTVNVLAIPTPIPTPTPNIIHNGTIYETVISPYTEKVWLDRNLGATMVCTESRDGDLFETGDEAIDNAAYVASQEACFGDYYQWGRNFDGHEDPESDTNTTLATQIDPVQKSVDGKFIMIASDWVTNGVDNNGSIRSSKWSDIEGLSVCPAGFRVPTTTEIQLETLDNGVTNRDTAFSNFLKIPTAGARQDDRGILYNRGDTGYLWTSSDYNSGADYIRYEFDLSTVSHHGRAFGRPVRCIKD